MSDTRTRLLDAAAEILLRDGATALTLDTVARNAGVSKGGLFYHFPTKQALAEAMIGRLVDQFDTALAEASDHPGAATRAYLDACVPPRATPITRPDRVAVALFTAALVDPDALVPLRATYRDWQRRLDDDGIDPAVAATVRLAADGWWLARLVDLAPPPPGRHEQVHATLVALIDGAT